ncbi:MAG TPA: HAMP domain-containing sensor histidine kinase [Balneolaceae bacterium]|nr:HAMP domain-containing sensor histidine kinase [Balneolaceae bacterium]
MKFSLTSNRINIILLILLILLGVGSFAYNQYLLNRILKKERASVKLWARATEYAANPTNQMSDRKLQVVANQLRQNSMVPDSLAKMVESAIAHHSSDNFVVQQIILKDRFKIPTIIENDSGKILASNHVSGKVDHRRVRQLANEHTPIEIHFGTKKNPRTQYVYYGESPTVRYLRWFPYIQFSLLALVLGMAFVSYRTISKSEQSNILVGMTKEAAHQLGTPLSSMYGWISLLREERPDDAFLQHAVSELENDVTRLQGVADRFNKIGSEPDLQTQALGPYIEEVMDYMERRLPRFGRKVEIKRSMEQNVRAKINPELFEWALENILKNSMNAIKSRREGASIAITVKRIEDRVLIDIKDSGHGIEKKYHKEIFKPGYSTKNRGWGLGLSLTKRIIEDYHNGKVFVASSKIGKGTTIRIILRATASSSIAGQKTQIHANQSG